MLKNVRCWRLNLSQNVLFLLALLLSVDAAAAGFRSSVSEPASSRKVENFNFGWKFHKGDVDGADNISFSDGSWRKLDLPHDWSIEGPFSPQWASCTGYLPAGIGWYRKSFKVPKSDQGKKVFIYFGGIYNNSEVWINGHSLGERPNGYISFYYDLTLHLNYDAENLIAVKVDHTNYADSRWYTGSGIYRDVKLIKTDSLYIKLWGVYASAKLPSENQGLLDIEVSIVNDKATASKAIVVNQLLQDDKVIGRTEQSIALGPYSESIVPGKIKVAELKLWDVDSPALYTLVSKVKTDGHVCDQMLTKVGFREVRFDANKGFFLNGRNLKLKGICMHHDAGTLGSAVPVEVLERRLDIVKEMGCNAIRTSHNPFSPEFYDMCDRKGFLVIDEVFDEWEGPKSKWVEGWNVGKASKKHGYSDYFEEWARVDLRDQVLRDRNHPCIIMWSIGNEVDYPNDPYSHEILNTEDNPQTWAKFDKKLPHAKRLGEVAKELVAVVKKYDTTRPVTSGLASALMSNKVGYADALDVVGYNYQEFQYNRDHSKYPGRVLYGSENGMALKAWHAVTDNDYIMGQFLWTGIEYLGEAGRYPKRHSTTGLIDLAGHKKPEYYFRQSLWSDEPMVFIGVSEPSKETGKPKSLWAHHEIEPVWNWKAGQKVKVTAFSNCRQVELFCNGKSLGRKQMADFPTHEITWEVPFEAGELSAVARNNGRQAAEFKLQTAGEPAKLIVSSDVTKLIANKQDVAHIEVVIADKKGVPVHRAKNRISCQVSGPIRLLGMEDANVNNTEDYKDNKQDAFKGRLLVYVQSLDRKGKGKIVLSSPGLKSAEVTIDVIAAKPD
jgi:beta-galactosidase